MASFEYQWWTINIHYTSGWCVTEFKGKTKENIIRQIKKEIADSNSEKNASLPWWERRIPIIEVDWDSLTFDRAGYQRRF